MMLPRFTILAGVLFAIGVYAAPVASAAVTDTTATGVSTASFYDGFADKKGDDKVPRPRPTPGPRDQILRLIGFSPTVIEQKKGDTPPRPRPKPGPKDGGEDE